MNQEELFEYMQSKGHFKEYSSYEEWSKASFKGQEKTQEDTYREWKRNNLEGKELEDYNFVFNE